MSSSSGLLMADLAMRRGDWKDAIRYSRMILKSDPTHLSAMELLAKALWKAQQFTPLLGTVRSLIALNPYEPAYHSLMGTTLQCLGRFNEAVAAFERAGDDAQIADMRRAIETWHAESAAELTKSDLVFRIEFSRNAEEACRNRGITTIARTEEAEYLPVEARPATRASVRMS